MKIFAFNRYAFTMAAVAAALAGCDGSQATITAPRPAPQSSLIAKDRSRQRLFLTDYASGAVLVYDATAKDPSPERRITIGVSEPSGDCIAGDGTLYVANYEGDFPHFNGWVSEYPPGKRRPSRIIKRGMGSPLYCAIDSAGNLWVTDAYLYRLKRLSGPSLVEYMEGSTEPNTVIMKGLSNPLGVAIDGSGNVYVANGREGSSNGNVVVYAPGTKIPARTITEGVTSPIGIAIDANGTLYVPNFSENTVTEFESGASEPYQTITKGLDEPVGVTVSEDGWVYVINAGNNSVAEFPPGSIEPSRRRISKDLYDPRGAAYSPPVSP